MADAKLGAYYPSPGLMDARLINTQIVVDVVTPRTARGFGLSRYMPKPGGFGPQQFIAAVANTHRGVPGLFDVAKAR